MLVAYSLQIKDSSSICANITIKLLCIEILPNVAHLEIPKKECPRSVLGVLYLYDHL